MKLVIFDLDGVIVSTDRFHYLAWKQVSEEQVWTFDEELNHRLRGVGRADCLKIILEANDAEISDELFQFILDKKNRVYRESLHALTPKDILVGVDRLLDDLDRKGILTAIGSSSRNTPLILERIQLDRRFAIVVDGNAIEHSKPHPEVFTKCAQGLGINPMECLVVEDAQAGIDAARAGGMKALGVGDTPLKGAEATIPDLRGIDAEYLESLLR